VITDCGEKAREMPKRAHSPKLHEIRRQVCQDSEPTVSGLGVFGEFDNPYLTFKPSYEAGILEVFADLVGKGLVFKQLKPIHWCVCCGTALAEAELEYKDVSSPSIFVNFPATDETVKRLIEMGLATSDEARQAQVCFMVWTTTPWTLAANLAVRCIRTLTTQPSVMRRTAGGTCPSSPSSGSCRRAGRRVDQGPIPRRREAGCEAAIWKGCDTSTRSSIRIRPTKTPTWCPGDYVTIEDGTGLVHTAPART